MTFVIVAAAGALVWASLGPSSRTEQLTRDGRRHYDTLALLVASGQLRDTSWSLRTRAATIDYGGKSHAAICLEWKVGSDSASGSDCIVPAKGFHSAHLKTFETTPARMDNDLAAIYGVASAETNQVRMVMERGGGRYARVFVPPPGLGRDVRLFVGFVRPNSVSRVVALDDRGKRIAVDSVERTPRT